MGESEAAPMGEFVWGERLAAAERRGTSGRKASRAYAGLSGQRRWGSFRWGVAWVPGYGGDVFEWTGSLWKPYPDRADDGREDPMDDERCFAAGVGGATAA